MAELIRQSLRMLRSTLPTTVRIVEDIAPVPLVMAEGDALHQVLINLANNAMQAIGGAVGTITIGLAVDGSADGGTSRPDGDWVRLWVSDTGCGMDAKIIDRVFEPFFTTKRVGEGTGLGLSVVHGIVSNHGGRITVDSELGKGTTFTIYLPAEPALAVAATAA
jgi:two-component system, cell cycle sensor histidine kinase and response regulator CckA